ncbi:hypothetical protein HND72_17145 [Pseudomonas putida]|uniref:Uncharacterized protein n=1 Tax=Pseudomonas taiwanensis SJ9 TaxID=1388762 RepID=V7DC04_9PSED|nr:MULTISPECIES: hypothetical protein [Pseudomonas]ESW39213.1 hypothetical protein O164_13360 [Pseudomonas taiwanensis SJ9]MDO1496283.1 hypothetical protein [Pseudomonas putida]
MFDARTDLPSLSDAQMSAMSLREVMEYTCKRMIAQRNDPAFERKKIDELAEFIEQHCLDDLTSMGCVDSFSFLADAHLSQDFPNIRSYEKSWRTAAAHQVWYKYNH